jgi:hypothetical protein
MREIIGALKKINSHEPNVIKKLIELTEHNALVVKKAAIDALRVMRIFEALEPLSQRLSPKDLAYNEIVQAMGSLARDSAEVITMLRDQLSTQTIPKLIITLATALGELMDHQSGPIIQRKLEEATSDTDRELLANALVALDDSSALPALAHAINSVIRTESTYHHFAEAMRKLRATPAQIPAFEPMHLDADDEGNNDTDRTPTLGDDDEQPTVSGTTGD